MNWRESAACRYEDPELFFPIREDGPWRRQIEQARSVCNRCPVVGACGAWALRNGESDGMWGGMTPGERRTLRLGRVSGNRPA